MRVILELTIEVARFRGTVAHGDAAEPVQFDGWLELMRVIEEIVTPPQPSNLP
jgi:hypothetical protein